jgi:molecular chaperone GrpE (heat shock protein)
MLCMSDDPSTKIDFADEMQQLANQANQKAGRGGQASAKMDKADVLLALGELVLPLAVDLEGIKRSAADTAMLLTALGKTINAQRAIPQSLETIAQQMQRLNSIESANQKLFDALHAELKGYKDNFLFDALQKPFIRGLVGLFDDLSAVHAQMMEHLVIPREEGSGDSQDREFLKRMAGNVEIQVHHLLEIFERMDVTVVQTNPGAPLDKRNHRTIGFVPAASQIEDGCIGRSVKPGFIWHERTVRTEEVMVRRWTPPPAQAPLLGTGERTGHETLRIDPPAS